MTRLRDPRLLAFCAGLGAALGIAPFNILIATPLGLGALIYLLAQSPTPKAAAVSAFWGGLGYFILALHWIVEPFMVYAAQEGWMAPFAILGLSGGLALFFALPVWAICALARPQSRAARIMAIVLALSFGEYLRAYILTGFPWAMFGHAMIGTNLRILAGVIGAHGMGFLLLGLAGLLAHFAINGAWRFAGGLLGGIVALWVFMPVFPAPQAAPDAPLIRIIQPNAAQDLKWRPEMKPFFQDRILDLTALPVREAGDARPDLVLYPETVLTSLLENAETIRQDLAAAAGGGMLFLGAQRLEGEVAYNSLALVDQTGAVTATYDKHHLVPFGEYMPLQSLSREMGLHGLANRMGLSFSRGSGAQVFDLGADLGTVFPMVCYEAIFPHYITDVPRPNWMFHATNDAWFGQFSGPYQHLALLQLRAAEQGLPVLRAANTGVSAVIDARGEIVSALGMGEMGVIDATLPPSLPPTLYARFGDVAYGVMLLGLLGAFLRKRRVDMVDPTRT